MSDLFNPRLRDIINDPVSSTPENTEEIKGGAAYELALHLRDRIKNQVEHNKQPRMNMEEIKTSDTSLPTEENSHVEEIQYFEEPLYQEAEFMPEDTDMYRCYNCRQTPCVCEQNYSNDLINTLY